MRYSDHPHFVLRRLHSLTGVVPIGVFLLEHFYTNSKALQGPAAFDQAVVDLARLPYVALIEAVGIWLPIAFHAVLGVLIATEGEFNAGRYGYARNWQYVSQRVSGVVLIFYLLFHTWTTRFNAEYLHSPSAFTYMQHQLANPGWFAFTALGILAASWHLGNGLFGFAIHWGLVTGRASQRLAARTALVVSLVLALVGLNALLAFEGHGFYPEWLRKPHATVDAISVPPNPAHDRTSLARAHALRQASGGSSLCRGSGRRRAPWERSWL